MSKFSFLIFADLHYKQDMYATTVADLQAILDRAAARDVELVLHAGDFCNDYPGSPEVTELLLKNPHGLSVCGCYGNHELETAGTAMDFVTPRLSNQRVTPGKPDGKIGNGCIGYYHFDRGEYRIVVTDTNYSLNAEGRWEHNLTGSYGPPKDNTLGNSLGPDQLLWLERVLTEAAENGLRCIVLSHAAFNSRHNASPDAELVRSIFKKVNIKRSGTVLLAINGHYHTDGCNCEGGVVYLDVNAVRNAWWSSTPHEKYNENTPTFSYIAYDDAGKPMGETAEKPFLSLREGKRTLFTKDPLSAIVTIDGDTLTIEGTSSDWVEGLAPDTNRTDVVPEIRNRTIKLP